MFLLLFFPQITLSYGMFENKSNIINLKGAFAVEEDPSRWEIVLYLMTYLISVLTLFFSKSNSQPSYLCLPGLSLCTVSCTQTPHGVPLRLPFRATAPFSSSSPSCLGIWKACGDQCLVLDRTAAVLLLQLCAVFNSFTGLLCGPPWDYSFLSAARTLPHNVLVEDPSSRQEVAFSVKLCRQSVELCDVYVACKCICNSHRMYCHIFKPFCQLYIHCF